MDTGYVVDGKVEDANLVIGAEKIEELPYRDVRKIFAVDLAGYNGHIFDFQLFIPVENTQGIYPHTEDIDNLIGLMEPYIDGNKIWQYRYLPNSPDNPINSDVTEFVRKYPYPHTQQKGVPDEVYWADVKKYQDRFREELTNNMKMLIHQNQFHGGIQYLPGNVTIPIAFNGGKLVGQIATELGIGQECFTTAQFKRIPIFEKDEQGNLVLDENGNPKRGMVIGIGNIEFAQAIKDGKPVCLFQVDDVQATWQTFEAINKLHKLAGAQIMSRGMAGVVGTQHPIVEEFRRSRIPTSVFISSPCMRLGDNAYLYDGDGNMVVGDAGNILGLRNAKYNVDLAHQRFGITTKAYQAAERALLEA